MDYELLDKINFPSDLREFKKKDLKQISEELRAKTIETVSKNWWSSRCWIRCC